MTTVEEVRRTAAGWGVPWPVAWAWIVVRETGRTLALLAGACALVAVTFGAGVPLLKILLVVLHPLFGWPLIGMTAAASLAVWVWRRRKGRA